MKKSLVFALCAAVVFVAAPQAQSQSRGARGNPGASTAAPAPITDPGFASRLGQNVGLRAVPPVTAAPGLGNINHPGLQPLPMTAQPLGSAPPIPNINFPGGHPSVRQTQPNPGNGSWSQRQGRHFSGRHSRGKFAGAVIVGVPVYPYAIYVTTPTTTITSTSDQFTYSAPAASSELLVTLLAFRDGTILAVVDYWLEEDYVSYFTLQGMRASAPLDRLDLPLTQRLNRERNVRFVLESR
ncbi:MAG: hypothetical protein HY648_07590 [Acidobacteria bacterium]|nr:hypothetical protein [Acidobacteriota bacterium]